MKSTNDLMNALTFPETSPELFWEENKQELISLTPKDLWETLILKSAKKKAEIIHNSDFEPVYFYEVISGKKKPSRDKIIRLLFGLQAELQDCQKILHLYEYRPLYPRIPRDSVFIYGFTHKLSLTQIQELLEKYGENQLK